MFSILNSPEEGALRPKVLSSIVLSASALVLLSFWPPALIIALVIFAAVCAERAWGWRRLGAQFRLSAIGIIAIRSIFALTLADVAVQQIPSSTDGSFNRLTLEVALSVAVAALWRTLWVQAKASKAALEAERKAAKDEVALWAERNRADMVAKDALLDKKDQQVMDMLKTQSELTATTMDTNRELRATVQASIETKRELTSAISNLCAVIKNRPCMISAETGESIESIRHMRA